MAEGLNHRAGSGNPIRLVLERLKTTTHGVNKLGKPTG
jgi:hypothetical protein